MQNNLSGNNLIISLVLGLGLFFLYVSSNTSRAKSAYFLTENCDNGKDDDKDGYVDLQEDECECEDIDLFQKIKISNPCGLYQFRLSVDKNSDWEYQWYRNGIAMRNQTKYFTQNTGNGVFQVRIFFDGDCYLSPPLITYENETGTNYYMCQGDSVFYANNYRFNAGVYREVFKSIYGCDSTASLNVIIADAIEGIPEYISINEGETLEKWGNQYTTTGIYTEVFPSSITGCDSIGRFILYMDTIIGCVAPNLIFPNWHKINLFEDPGFDSRDECCGRYIDVHNCLNYWIPIAYSPDYINSDCFNEYSDTSSTFFQDNVDFDSTSIQLLFRENHHLEALGTCLKRPIYQGNEYKLSLDLYQFEDSFRSDYASHKLAIYGVKSCADLKYLGNKIICNELPNIHEFGSFSLFQFRFKKWFNQSITFTAPDNYDAIIIGHSCNEEKTLAGGVWFSIDNLQVEERDLRSFPPISGDTICVEINNGDSYLFNNMNLNMDGVYADTMQTKYQCDSIFWLKLSVIDNSCDTITRQLSLLGDKCTSSFRICVDTMDASISFLWISEIDTIATNGGVSCLNITDKRNQLGWYHVIGTNDDNQCYKSNLLFVPNDNAVVINIYDNICHGQQVDFHGMIFTEAGMSSFVSTGSNGCDSTTILNLTVDDILRDTIQETIREGLSYTFGGVEYTMAGYYSDTLRTQASCDSISVLDLIVQHCDAENTVRMKLDLVGDYCSDNFMICTDIKNSDIEYNWIYKRDTVYIGKGESCFSFEKPNISYGEYYVFGKDSGGVCYLSDTINVLDLSPISIERDTNLCDGQSIVFNGYSISSDTSVMNTQTGVNSCDSTYVLNITFNAIIRDTIQETIREGLSYTFGGVEYTMAGYYSDTLRTQASCDSISVLDLIVQQCDAENIVRMKLDLVGEYCTDSFMICTDVDNSDIEYHWIYKRDTVFVGKGVHCFDFEKPSISYGEYHVFGKDSGGVCYLSDTINVLDLSPISIERDTNLCDGQSIVFNGQTVTTNETVISNDIGSNSCDSTYALHINFSPILHDTIQITIQDGSSYNFGGTDYYFTGFYSNTFDSRFGCDSISNLNLFVQTCNESDITLQLRGDFCADSFQLCTDYNESEARYFWVLDGDTLQQAKGLSCLDFEKPLIKTGYYFVYAMDEMNNCFRSNTVQVLDINPVTNEESLSICTGRSFDFNGQRLDESGQYFYHGQSINTCDSSFVLNLTIEPIIIKDTLFVTIEMGESFDFNGETITSTGVYSETIFNEAGCEEIHILDIDVEPAIYFPNIISSSEGSINRYFTAYSDIDLEIVINKMSVYDRWGNAVFQRDNIRAGDIQNAWDGTFNGEEINTGVFYYIVVLTLPNGQQQIYKGDVTLI